VLEQVDGGLSIMRRIPPVPPETAFPIVGGLVWLLAGAGSGVPGFLVSVLPGALLLAGGVATIFFIGDERTPRIAAVGGALGLVLAVPAVVAIGIGMAGLLWALSALGFIASGWTSRRFAGAHVGVPDPPNSPVLALKLALDELNLGIIPLARRSPLAPGARPVREEIDEVHAFFKERGWLERPAEYHVLPPALEKPEIRPLSSRLVRCEHLSFESGYTPHAIEPGGERWQAYVRNRTAHAWLLRHRDGPRPWLVCIHGFGLGVPALDLPAFRAAHLHRRLGLNLLFPVLPLHGPRKEGLRGGDLFLGRGFLNTVHAEAQAVWDLRRMLGWIRAQGASTIGVFGISLGGYTAALLATFESELAPLIAGIPATDLIALVRRNDRSESQGGWEEEQIPWGRIGEVLRVVSPLAMPARVPPERCFIFAGAVDRLVPPEQALALWQHWKKPRLVWYAGGHISQHWEPEVRQLQTEVLSQMVPGGVALD
jgi:hypothetical protein